MNFSSSRIPRPPSCFGCCTLRQFTKQWPVRALSEPCHRKRQQMRSICFSAHFDNLNTDM
jgi:hypothetical protein